MATNSMTQPAPHGGQDTITEPEKLPSHSSSLTSPADILATNPFFSTQRTSSSRNILQSIRNHLTSRHDMKQLFKSSIALWIITIFIVIDPILRVYGQAMFFGCVVLLLAPPSGIVLMQLLISASIIIGIGLAWAWGVITMKAALAARPEADTNARLAQLQQEATRNTTNAGQATGQTAYAQILILNGFMLDARVTAVYYCMMCFFIYFMARLRAANPKFIAVQVFSTIIADVFITTGPLLPRFNGSIPQTLIKPAATAIAVGLVCNILIFPESTSHIVLTNIKQVLSPMTSFIDACRISLDHDALPMNLQTLKKNKSDGIASFKALDARAGFLPLDVSVCRWNTADIVLLRKPLRFVFITWAGLIEAQIHRSVSKVQMDKLDQEDKARKEGQHPSNVGHHQLSQQLDFAQLFRNAETEELIVKSMAALQKSADPLLILCKEALEAVIETISLVNDNKYYGRPSEETCRSIHEKHEMLLESLRKECDRFVATTSSRILDPHNHLFDKDGQLNPPKSLGVAPLRGVVLACILEERIVSFARALINLLAQIVALEEARTKQRLWFPKKIQNFGYWILGHQPAPQVTPVMPEMEEVAKKTKVKRRRNRHQHNDDKIELLEERSIDGSETNLADVSDQLTSIHLHRRKKRNPTGQVLLAATRWSFSDGGLYALRVVIVTVAVGICAAIPSSAGFFYRERGLWALIMAQLGIVPYAADFLFSLLSRVAGTILGGVIGMVAWYIGSGGGSGNAYGIAAIMAPLCVAFMYLRLFSSPILLQAVIITAVTAYLTISYSWVDGHIPSYGDPGVGYAVFWRRVLLVLVGFAVSAIVIYLPRPPSASRHYRKVLAQTLSSFKDRYALLIKDITTTTHQDYMKANGEEPQQTPKKDPQPTLMTSGAVTSPVLTTMEKATIATADTLSSIIGPIQLLHFEFSSVDFTAAGLTRITSLAMNINFDIFQLFYYSAQLPPMFKTRFLLLSGVFEEKFAGDFMAVLTLLGQSLQSGEALPSVLCAPLVVRAFKERILGAGAEALKGNGSASKATPLGHLLGPVTRKALEDNEEGFRKYCVVLSAMIGLLNAVDEMVLVVKEELGEAHLVDVERWGDLSTHAASIQLGEEAEKVGLLSRRTLNEDDDSDGGHDQHQPQGESANLAPGSDEKRR